MKRVILMGSLVTVKSTIMYHTKRETQYDWYIYLFTDGAIQVLLLLLQYIYSVARENFYVDRFVHTVYKSSSQDG